MTKNNAFKKTVRAYMEDHDLSYTEARKILDEESYLQGTGSITLIIGTTGAGKTVQFREMLKNQTLPTAVLLAHREEIDYVGTTHRVETFSNAIDPLVAGAQSKAILQNLVNQKKYSLFAIDGTDYCANQGEYFLDSLPHKADLILTFQFNPIVDNNVINEALDHLDRMNLSRSKLRDRVKLIKHAYINYYHSFDPTYELERWSDRFKIAEYHL